MPRKITKKAKSTNQPSGQVDTIVMPPIGSKWYSRKYGTRHVHDRTYGGDVVYIQGKMPINSWMGYYQKICTLEEWHEYQKTAKEVVA